MLLIQVLIIIFALLVLYGAIVRFRKGELSLWVLWFWILFWAAVVVTVLLPETTSWLAERLGVGRGVDVIIYLSIVLLFYLIFRIFIKIEKIEREITIIVREAALDKARDKKEKS